MNEITFVKDGKGNRRGDEGRAEEEKKRICACEHLLKWLPWKGEPT